MTTTTAELIRDYANLLRTGTSEGDVAVWLYGNARQMNESMFFASGQYWRELTPAEVLTLRACAPDGVFTATAKGGYLTQVGEVPDLVDLADVLFASDYNLVTRLPGELAVMAPMLVALMQMAYRQRIRSADEKVKAM